MSAPAGAVTSVFICIVVCLGSGKGMARVGSVGKLDASGGSAVQLLGRCLAKAVCLGVVVFLTEHFALPRVVLEAVYGAPVAAMRAVHAFCLAWLGHWHG